MRLLEPVQDLRRIVERYGNTSAVAAVCLSTLAFLPVRDFLGREQWGWPYLLVVGTIAGTAGIGPAILAAVLAFLAWNFFFFPPFHTLQVANSGDIVHLIAFLIVAVAVGWQTGLLRQREALASREGARLLMLNRLARGLVSDDAASSLSQVIADSVGSALPGAKMDLVVADEYGRAEGVDPPRERSDAVTTALELRSGDRLEGRIIVTTDTSLTSDERELLDGVAGLLTTHLRALRLSRAEMLAAATREAEALRSALVSSVSHELKTPLASLTAAVSDLIDPGVHRSAEEIRASLASVAGDVARLDSAIADLLDLSRLEGRAWLPRIEPFEIGEVIGGVMARLPDVLADRIVLDVDEDLPSVQLDFAQIARALSHVLGNALEYSEGPVTFGASESEGRIAVFIEDAGPGIADDELPFIFDKFYRGRAGKASRSSTGLGLSLTKEIVSSNAGDIRVFRVAPHGTRFTIGLPIDAEDRG